MKQQLQAVLHGLWSMLALQVRHLANRHLHQLSRVGLQRQGDDGGDQTQKQCCRNTQKNQIQVCVHKEDIGPIY